jgi:hypothetical protein
VDRLQKTFPAAARRIAFIDPSIHRYINQGTEISQKVQPGYLSVLV